MSSVVLHPLADMTTQSTLQTMAPIQEERGASPFHELMLVSQPSGGHLRTNLNTSLRGCLFLNIDFEKPNGTKTDACVFWISLHLVCVHVC